MYTFISPIILSEVDRLRSRGGSAQIANMVSDHLYSIVYDVIEAMVQKIRGNFANHKTCFGTRRPREKERYIMYGTLM